MTHPFLSDEWFAAVRAVRDKYVDQEPPFPQTLRINLVVTATPFDTGDLKIHLDTTSGHPSVEPGMLDAPDCTVTTDYGIARKLIVDQDPAAVMQAFMSGKIKVQGDMSKLLAINMAMPDETAKTIAREIKAITA